MAKVQFQVRLPEELKEKLDKKCEQEALNRTQYLIKLIEASLKREVKQ